MNSHVNTTMNRLVRVVVGVYPCLAESSVEMKSPARGGALVAVGRCAYNGRMTNLPLVMIEWVDASRLSDGWMDVAAIPDPYPHRCVSVGFLVSENEHAKILIPTIGDTEHPENSHSYGGMMIPVSAVISQKMLIASSIS